VAGLQERSELMFIPWPALQQFLAALFYRLFWWVM
jgi:hypothetical protein